MSKQNSKTANEAPVKDAKVLVKSAYPGAEVLKEEGKIKHIIEGGGSWFRLVKRANRKADEILFVDGNTNLNKFKRDCESLLANK